MVIDKFNEDAFLRARNEELIRGMRQLIGRHTIEIAKIAEKNNISADKILNFWWNVALQLPEFVMGSIFMRLMSHYEISNEVIPKFLSDLEKRLHEQNPVPKIIL